MSSRAKTGIAAAVALVIVIVVAVFSLRDGAPSAQEVMQAPQEAGTAGGAALTVELVRPSEVVWPVVVQASGAIAPWQEASVASEVSGAPIIEVHVDIGDRVESGQLLARFDAGLAEALYAQQKAALAEAQARLKEAVANARRADRLKSTKDISEQDLIKAETTEQAARAQVELARARLKSQEIALRNTDVLAPDDGTITARGAMLGAVAGPGTELFRLLRQNRLEWRAELVASDLAAVAAGDEADIRLPGGTVATGKVRQVSPVLDTNSRTGIAYVALEGEHAGAARSGMFADGTIRVDERAGIALPASAIVQRDGYEYVFVVERESARAAQVKVESGRRSGSYIEIIEGLTLDDSVVASGAAFLTDGDRVRIVRERGPELLGGA